MASGGPHRASPGNLEAVPLPELLRTSTEATARRVTASGAKLVILGEMLQTHLGRDPLDCLATAEVLGDCAVPVPVEQSLTNDIARSTPPRCTASKIDAYRKR